MEISKKKSAVVKIDVSVENTHQTNEI